MKAYRNLLLLIILTNSCTMGYHVSMDGNDANPGTVGRPLRTISRAAELAMPGDHITVHAGVYRERINPPRGGISDDMRITYRAEDGDKVEIKGSEIITGWVALGNGVWRVSIPDYFFGDYNPYEDHIAGDWLVDGEWNHTGEVYLNGKSLYETDSLSGVLHPESHERSLDSRAALHTWYCENRGDSTVIWANFQGVDPNTDTVEINVRSCCFYPDTPGRNFITVDGFHMSQAATQWAPPSAEQVGLIGTHWSRGWIIENCTIHDSKCSGITLGKDRKSGHNGWIAGTSGADHYNEIVLKALEGSGWSMENIGGHQIRENLIFNCEQAGICGSLGAVNSEVSNNHIHHIWTKRLFFGHEIAAIKFHAPIDVIIKENRLHDAHKGLWMDWMTQGTRITGNICYSNEAADLFAEVNHGPYLVDNNIFLSGIRNWSEGGAYVHNLIAGNMVIRKVLDRYTPYHFPNSTAIMGMSNTTLGDDRFYNNIFIARDNADQLPGFPGLGAYNRMEFEHPVFVSNNIYYNGAESVSGEMNLTDYADFDPDIRLTEKEDGLYLQITLSNDNKQQVCNQLIGTDLLGTSARNGQSYENQDGSDLFIDSDFFGNKRDESNPSAGPFKDPGTGDLEILIWETGK